MIYAAGILFVAKSTGNALFLKRSAGGDHSGEWCFPGGKIEAGESPEQAAVRECVEEIGSCPDGARREHSIVTLNNPVTAPAAETVEGALSPVPGLSAPEPVTFTTFLQMVDEEFTPVLDGEHTGYAWAPVFDAPAPLHPGCAISIAKFNWHETDVARAMVRGELVSPQRYENISLFLVRITGTGNAYRSALQEHVIRLPEEYLTQDFLDRCQGLTVVALHPKRKMLDSKEFQDRVVGNVILPFIRGDEVWGVAKIYDAATAALMSTGKLSTSPGVVFRNPNAIDRLTLEDGVKLSIEGAPSLLDHLAVCEAGVWDKGEAPNGIEVSDITNGETDMDKDDKKADGTKADATKVDAVAKADDAVPSALVTYLDSFKDSIVDSVKEMCDSVMKRADAMEDNFKKDAALRADAAGKKDADDKDGDKKDDADCDPKKDGVKADADKEDDKKDDSAKKDGDDMDKDKKDDAVKADSDDIRKSVADMAKRMDAMAARSDADEDAMADVQARFDSVYAEHGSKAPRPMAGETQMAYRRRLTRGLQSHSKTFAKADLAVISADSATFDAVEATIISDAQTAARSPTTIAAGTLREHVKIDDSGRRVRSFFGTPGAWMGSFTAQRQSAKLVKPSQFH